MNQTQAETIIETYESLRTKCFERARANNGALMGPDAWLLYAIEDTDMNLSPDGDGIYCHGIAYTTQTMSNETFDFTIPYDLLED